MGDLVPVVGGGLTVIGVIVALAIAFLRQVGAGEAGHASQVAGWSALNEAANAAVVAANLRADAAEKRAAAAELQSDQLRAQADEMRQLAEVIAAGTAARLSALDERVAQLLEHRPEGLNDAS